LRGVKACFFEKKKQEIFASLAVVLAGPAFAGCPGYSVCPAVDYPLVLRGAPASALIAQIDATKAAALKAALVPGIPFNDLVADIGQAIVSDRTLSVNNSEACSLCHTPATGFSGGLAGFNRGGGVFPGAVRWRTGFRTPQSLAYAAFAPVLNFNATSGVFTGGAFWDSRATGLLTGSAAADQAMVPFTTPFEMALPDPACAVRRAQLAPYASVFAAIWGANTFNITWPANVDTVCAISATGGPPALDLSSTARAQATETMGFIAQTILTYESSNLASAFSSKYDLYRAGKVRLTPAETTGLSLFAGKAQCAACHSLAGTRPLLTNFTSANIGVPHNALVPYLREDTADADGYVANPAGESFIDTGLGGFLASAANTNAVWAAQAANFMGTFQVPTLRNVAAVPTAGFVRPYMHNGTFTDLKTVVHFYNTRDVLPRCTDGHGIGVTCWPAPEVAANENTAQMGNLGLTTAEETDIVAFLHTLTDGFKK
jgi:cytochrome c peroxidase